MNNKAQNFGRLAPVQINSKERCEIMHKRVQELQNPSVETVSEKCAAWSSYFTMVFVSVGAFMPHTAAAAINNVTSLIG